jgi:hypothetical protein
MRRNCRGTLHIGHLLRGGWEEVHRIHCRGGASRPKAMRQRSRSAGRSSLATAASSRSTSATCALMQKAIAYDLQVRAFGRLPARAKRSLRSAAKADGRSALSNLPSRGTRLVPEWHGALHEVEVLEDGYLWRGAQHRSLSAIACAITGTKWSGPRFFGLVARP